MTKEELEKEFEKYLKDSSDYYDPREPLTERKLLQMWLDCAEPREKQIQIDAEQIRALQKQNGELTDELKDLRQSIKDYGAGCYENGLRNGKRKLEEQLTKAKELLKQWLSLCGFKVEKLAKDTEQFLNREVEK